MLIIIDGYNLIYAVPELGTDTSTRPRPGGAVTSVDSGTVRDNLVTLLSRYKSIKGYEMTVVFDGTTYGSHYNITHKQVISGIEIIFSGAASDADTVIKNLASRHRDPGNICVVTSDREIKDFVVKKCGNTVVDSKKFFREISKIVNEQKEPYSDEPRSKFEGPTEEEVKYWLSVFTDRGKGDKKDTQQ